MPTNGRAERYRSYLQSSFWYLEIDRSSLCVLRASEFLQGAGGGQMLQTLLPTSHQSSKPSHPQAAVMLLVTRHCPLTKCTYCSSISTARITEKLNSWPMCRYLLYRRWFPTAISTIVPKQLFHCFTFSWHFYSFRLGFKGKIFCFAWSNLRQDTGTAQYKRTQKENGWK